MVTYFYLEFPREIITKPLVSSAVRQTDASINILRARIDETHGEMIADVEGEGPAIERFITYLKDQGVIVRELKESVSVKVDGCIHCGACVSVCPVKAIHVTPDWDVVFDSDKCISCRVCIPVCPVGAVQGPEI